MKADKVRNTFKTRARAFFDGDEAKAAKYQKYFNWDNKDLINLAESPLLGTEEKAVITKIIDYNRVSVKSKSDTNGKSNLPFTKAALELTQTLMQMRAGDTIQVSTDEDPEGTEKELVSVQILVKYKDDAGVKTKSVDKHGNGIILYR